MKIKELLAVTLAGILAVSTAVCSREPALIGYDAQFLQLFDTIASVMGYAKDKGTFTAYTQKLHDELEVYYQLYDIYHEYEGTDNLRTINDNAGIEPVVVDRKIIDILEFTKELNARIDGYFNVAMGSMLSIQHEYRTTGVNDPMTTELPPMETLEEVGKHMGISNVVIDKEASTVYLTGTGMSLDVGAIARGYTTETVRQKLEEDGLTKALVSVGGNVRTIGTKDSGSKWKLRIQNPDLASDTKFLHMIAVAGMSLVTSGDYQRYYTVDGVQCHHIINPDTLMSWFEYDSVSVLYRDSGMADALSTAVFNMRQEDGQTLIESLDGMETMWLYPDGSERYSFSFQAYVEDE